VWFTGHQGRNNPALTSDQCYHIPYTHFVIISGKSKIAVTTTIRLRFDARSTAYQMHSII